jgi:two-component system, cell cycle response regulator
LYALPAPQASFLAEVQNALNEALRNEKSVRSYDMVGRYGGEEFLVILNNCSIANAEARAENLRAAIATKPIWARSTSFTVSISIGLAFSTDFENRGVDEIIQSADTALYAAKAAGRNCVRIGRPAAGQDGTETSQKETTSAGI